MSESQKRLGVWSLYSGWEIGGSWEIQQKLCTEILQDSLPNVRGRLF